MGIEQGSETGEVIPLETFGNLYNDVLSLRSSGSWYLMPFSDDGFGLDPSSGGGYRANHHGTLRKVMIDEEFARGFGLTGTVTCRIIASPKSFIDFEMRPSNIFNRRRVTLNVHPNSVWEPEASSYSVSVKANKGDQRQATQLETDGLLRSLGLPSLVG